MDDNIKDNPSFQKFSKDLEGLEVFHNLYKMASFFGIKNQEMSELFEKLPSLRQQFEDIAYTPDKFNRFFLSRGWVAYETMNLETMKSAVQFAEQGDIDEAENTLINYHSPDSIEWKVNILWGIPAFRSIKFSPVWIKKVCLLLRELQPISVNILIPKSLFLSVYLRLAPN